MVIVFSLDYLVFGPIEVDLFHFGSLLFLLLVGGDDASHDFGQGHACRLVEASGEGFLVVW